MDWITTRQEKDNSRVDINPFQQLLLVVLFYREPEKNAIEIVDNDIRLIFVNGDCSQQR